MRPSARTLLLLTLCHVRAYSAAFSDPQESLHGDPVTIRKITGAIAVDGDLSDEGWKSAAKVETWYETNPGDNVTPKVKSVAWLGYDDTFFYAAFEFSDPNPGLIRAPFGDRDNVPGYTDYGGVILDTRNDGRTGLLLLANARGIQYDAITDDVTGNEDSSPDFFWDSSAKVTNEGWVLEMRVPFTSLRYGKEDPQTWGILLYRNYPREFRYQMFSAKVPHGGNCFICRSNVLEGLGGLPSGGHLVIAPSVTATQNYFPQDGLGTPLESEGFDGDAHLDLKWTPSARTVVDGTINPDFSQIESDVAQITANERFALFYPEKRPFFLEGVELLTTPVQAVYTRTISNPRWGARATGKFDDLAYTALVAQDRAGGSVLIPGPNGTDLAPQDNGSLVFIGRIRQDLGRSFVSLLATSRNVEGQGANQVLGPDFQWRIGEADTITGQLLGSRTSKPDPPATEGGDWTGETKDSHAGELWWSHQTSTLDVFVQYRDYGNHFRADNGFVPQNGFRQEYLEEGWTFRPTTGFLTRLRLFFITDYSKDRDNTLINRQFSPGAGMDGRWSSFMRYRFAWDRVSTIEPYTEHELDNPDFTTEQRALPRRRFIYTAQVSPSRTIALLVLDGDYGEQIDFANGRRGHGGTVAFQATIRPMDHLELAGNFNRRWLDVKPEGGDEGRLFTADVARLRATYTFTARSYLRLIGQNVSTRREPERYNFEVTDEERSTTASALFAYKLNWQSVLYLGYGDDRELLNEPNRDSSLEPASRAFFLKLSYALQR